MKNLDCCTRFLVRNREFVKGQSASWVLGAMAFHVSSTHGIDLNTFLKRVMGDKENYMFTLLQRYIVATNP